MVGTFAYKRKNMQTKKGKVFFFPADNFHLRKVINPYSAESQATVSSCYIPWWKSHEV